MFRSFSSGLHPGEELPPKLQRAGGLPGMHGRKSGSFSIVPPFSGPQGASHALPASNSESARPTGSAARFDLLFRQGKPGFFQDLRPFPRDPAAARVESPRGSTSHFGWSVSSHGARDRRLEAIGEGVASDAMRRRLA